MNAESTPRTRRIGRWLVGSGIGLATLTALGVIAWFWLPQRYPYWVTEHSPWVEPVVRSVAHWWPGQYPHEAKERFDEWGPSAYPALTRLLQDPALRESALFCYPFTKPFAEEQRWKRSPKEWESLLLYVKPIYDGKRTWFQAICYNGRSFELDSPRSAGFIGLQDAYLLTCNRASKVDDLMVAHPILPGRRLLLVKFELSLDCNVPYWVIDRVISFIKQRGDSNEPVIAHLDMEVSYLRNHTSLLPTTSLPTPADAHVVTLVPHSPSDPTMDVDVIVDAQPAITVTGLLNSRLRHDGIARAIEQGLSAVSPRRNAICVRGGMQTLWADVVAGLDGARMANHMTGDEWKTEGTDDPATRKSLTLAPAFVAPGETVGQAINSFTTPVLSP